MQNMEANFVHLHLHTEYSLSDSLLSIPALIEKTQALRMPAIAITDLSNLYATVKFYQAAFQAGIKPIIGADVYIGGPQISRLTLLCQTNQGYHNLLKLISRSYLEGQSSGKPVIQKSWLNTLNEGLI